MANRKIRTVVVGVGYLGQWHARKVATLKSVKLLGVVDKDFGRADALAKELGCTAFGDVEDVPDDIESAIVAVPTEHHYETADALLNKGAHLLIEKPFTGSPQYAQKLIEKAKHLKRKIAVGLVERMNPAFQTALRSAHGADFIEARRLAPFKQRAAKVDVVKDLMIHDIDLVLCLLGKDAEVDYAWGESVVTEKLDLAGAILKFKKGARAYLLAGRIFSAEERVMNIIDSEGILALDLKERRTFRLKRGREGIVEKALKTREDDALRRELAEFFDMIKGKNTAIARGEEGLSALELACGILKKANKKR